MSLTLTEKSLIEKLLNGAPPEDILSSAQAVDREAKRKATLDALNEPVSVYTDLDVAPPILTPVSIGHAMASHAAEVAKTRERNRLLVQGIAGAIVGAAAVATTGGSAATLPAILAALKIAAEALRESVS